MSTEAKGLDKLVNLKSELSEMMGTKSLARKEITKKLWAYIKEHKLQAKTPNGSPTGEGKYIVADKVLLPLFKNTNSVSKSSGKTTDLRNMKEGDTIDQMQLASVVGANVE